MGMVSTLMSMTVHKLRSQWKPIKQRLAAKQSAHPTNVRFHRACSWLQRVEPESGRRAMSGLRVMIVMLMAMALYFDLSKNLPSVLSSGSQSGPEEIQPEN